MLGDNIIVRTILPILLLVGTGFISRKIRILKQGDERVLSSYVYYFALPSLFFINMTETRFTEETARFMLAGIFPVLITLMLYIVLYFTLGFSKNTLYLIMFCTFFGSLAFFGIPFTMFAFPTEQGEHLATLSAAAISVLSVSISIVILELYKLKDSSISEGVKVVAKKLSRNPLILSIFSGILLSLVGVAVPTPLSTFLHMLGESTSAIAIFMLGVFLYGRRYVSMFKAFKLSLLRIVLLPTVAFLSTAIFNISDIEKSVIVLMNSMPVAISTMVLSERYNFHKDVVASLNLISTLGSVVYLGLWLLILGY